MPRLLPVALLVAALSGCAPSVPPPEPPAHAARESGHDDARLAAVADVHGAAGPWAVAGYRMGEYALQRLGLARFSFDLEVEHRSPHAVQLSCIADGAAAATGASLGKLNLTLRDADEAHTVTVYRNKATGAEVALRPSAAFVARFRDVPREQLGEAGKVVLGLPDAQVFEEVAPPR